ncbi:MAG: hypothetical protein AB7N76_15705 [Planctomycetota bacterium]
MKTTRILGLAACLAAGALFGGCRDSGGGGTLVIVSGAGGTAATGSSSGTTTTTPGSFSLVKSDPGGGTIVESADGKLRKIAGVFHEDLTLESRFEWVLDAPVFLGIDDASKQNTITIEAGTTIKGRGGTPPSMLVIRRGAKLRAEGTATSPIVFTSAQPAGSRAPGDWGGLILNGQAPVNDIGPGGELPFGEGGSGRYGGTKPDDSSGVLRYVRVEFAGHVFTSDDELNGIAFQGVGRGTTVDFVQVHRNADDGVELFGGTVELRHLLITGCQDDSLDWTSGWQGKAQFVVLQQWAGGADNGIEADNLEAKNDATPRSKPLISNLTLVGPKDAGALSGTGFVLRRGTGAKIWNSIVTGMNQYGLDVDSTATWNVAYADAPGSYNTLSGELAVENTIFFGNALGNFRDDAGEPQTDTAFNGHQANANQLVDPQLTDAQNEAKPDFRLKAGSPALGKWISPGDPFFATATFQGAMDATTDWTAGWTTAAAK